MQMDKPPAVPVQRIPAIHLQLVRGSTRKFVKNETANENPSYGILSNAGGYFESKTYQGSRLDIPTQRRRRPRSVQEDFEEFETLNC